MAGSADGISLTGRLLFGREGRALSARGLPPPSQLLSKSFWSDLVDGRKIAGQPQVATGGSLERMSNREVNSPDFLAGARTSRRTPDGAAVGPEVGEVGLAAVAGHLHRINPQSTTNLEQGRSCHEYFTILGFNVVRKKTPQLILS